MVCMYVAGDSRVTGPELHARRGRRGALAIRIGSDNELVSGIGQGTNEIRDQGRDANGGDGLNARGICISGW